MTPHLKKLIEVALPLEAINKEAAREKSIRHGHPSTLHLWWARRPLAAARAVIFAQMVDDPGSVPEEFPTPEAQEAERQRLFRLIEELVKWENTTNEPLLEKARAEIRRSWARYAWSAGILPATHQAGGTPALPATKPKRFHGTVQLDPNRVGRDAGRIADEVIAHLAGLLGSDVQVTLEIDANVPNGVPDQTVQTVTENCQTLKFKSHGFENS